MRIGGMYQDISPILCIALMKMRKEKSKILGLQLKKVRKADFTKISILTHFYKK